MKKDHYAKATIEVTGRRLRLIAKSVDLDNPKEVTKYLANKQGKNSCIERNSLPRNKASPMGTSFRF
jgi:hypothetical protein